MKIVSEGFKPWQLLFEWAKLLDLVRGFLS